MGNPYKIKINGEMYYDHDALALPVDRRPEGSLPFADHTYKKEFSGPPRWDRLRETLSFEQSGDVVVTCLFSHIWASIVCKKKHIPRYEHIEEAFQEFCSGLRGKICEFNVGVEAIFLIRAVLDELEGKTHYVPEVCNLIGRRARLNYKGEKIESHRVAGFLRKYHRQIFRKKMVRVTSQELNGERLNDPRCQDLYEVALNIMVVCFYNYYDNYVETLKRKRGIERNATPFVCRQTQRAIAREKQQLDAIAARFNPRNILRKNWWLRTLRALESPKHQFFPGIINPINESPIPAALDLADFVWCTDYG